VRDYRLDAIFNASGSFVLNQYLEVWLMDAISDFEDYADQDLTYVTSGSTTEGYFTTTLNTKNKLIISKIMTKYWLQKTINDVLMMGLHVTDRDFKTFSSAQNLRAKQDYLNSLKEELSQEIIDYTYQRNNFTNWKNQDFD
jgi:hypothetical protein